RVEVLVAAEAEQAAVGRVGAALGDDVDDAAGGAPELRRVALGGDLVLLDGLGRELLEQAAHHAVVVVAAIDVDDHVAAGGAAVAGPADLALGRVVVVRGARAGNQQGEVLELAPVERDVLDHGRGDDVTHVG